MDNLTEINEAIFDDYDNEVFSPKARVPEKILKTQQKAKTYLQFLISSYEPHLRWTNSSYFKDRDALYSLAHRVGESDLKGILDWCKAKQTHVRVVLKLLSNKLK